jgi:hypothetical protein
VVVVVVVGNLFPSFVVVFAMVVAWFTRRCNLLDTPGVSVEVSINFVEAC